MMLPGTTFLKFSSFIDCDYDDGAPLLSACRSVGGDDAVMLHQLILLNVCDNRETCLTRLLGKNRE